MKGKGYWKWALTAGLILLCAGVAFSWPPYNDRGGPYVGIYFDLTEAFNRAMDEQDAETKSYTTDSSEKYLKQIAVSTEFLVKTNLELIRQQQEIINLLQQRQSCRVKVSGQPGKKP